MMQTIHLLPGVTLRVFRDTRFKQGCLSFQLAGPMNKAESAMNALLPSVLLRGTNRCPDLRSITERLDTLYGAGVSPLVRRIGDYQTCGLYCSFMDDRFALPGDRVMGDMLAFLEELLLDSPLEDGGFRGFFVESEKKNLISTIESELNDKRIYAMNKLLKTMCSADTFGLPRLGSVEDVAAIDPAALRRHYETMLRIRPIEVFYVGSGEAARVADLLTPMVSKLERQVLPLPEQTDFHSCPGRDEVETMEVTQGKLCMGFVTPITNQKKEFPAMQVLNTLFGAGMTSKLFQNVREKLSLCYSIGSAYYGSKGILVVSAGIDFDKEEKTRREILRQLEDCQAGRITREELEAAKQAIISALRATHDSPRAIEGYYATAALSGIRLTMPEYMAAVKDVTVEQAAEAARSLELHTTYFLKGASQ